MEKSDNWHLLVTTDLKLSFIEVLEVYQIRWGIEVFFKECKQYLNLEGCMASNFDAEIASVSLCMIQYTMLSYCKRVNYQTSLGALFKGLRNERICHNLLVLLLNIFWQLADIFCNAGGFDLMTVQQSMMRDPQMLRSLEQLLPEKIINKAA